jgi:uncharacterized protein (TIGR02147 family)
MSLDIVKIFTNMSLDSPQPYYLRSMRQEFEKRKERRPGYSLRLFAQKLKMDSGSLSQILNGVRIPSVRVATRILENLELPSENQKLFWVSLAESQQSRSLKRLNPYFRKITQKIGDDPSENKTTWLLHSDQFHCVSQWHSTAILELMTTNRFQHSSEWIARELGISKKQAEESLENLLRLKLIQKSSKGEFKKTFFRIKTSDKAMGLAQQIRQKQSIEKSLIALTTLPPTVRDHTCLTIAIDPSRIHEAKKLIDQFIASFADHFEKRKKTTVYELSIGMFPLQKINQEQA